MEPAETTYAVEALGEDVLEEAANQFEGFQIDVLPVAGVAVPVAPAHAAIWKQGQIPVASGGLEDVAAQVLEGGLAGTGAQAVNDPALLPNPAGQGIEGVGGLTEEYSPPWRTGRPGKRSGCAGAGAAAAGRRRSGLSPQRALVACPVSATLWLMSIAELRKLPPTEKLRIIEALWSDLAADGESFPSTAWHEDALRQTEAEFAAGRIAVLDWEDAKKELRRRFE
jgi:putative addiction module component (TIGR02574 family)